MKTTSLIFIFAALMLAEALSLQASAVILPSSPQQTSQDVLRPAQGSGKSSEKAEIKFEGNKVFTTGQLLDSLEKANEHYDGRCLSLEAGYNSDIFEVCLRSVRLLMQSKGYLQAKLGEPRKEGSGRNLKIIVPIEEGALYRLGKISVEDSKLFPPQQLVEIIGIRKGDIANRDIIAEGLNKIWRLYADRGYLECTSSIDPIYSLSPDSESEGIVDFVISIDEGRRFTVSSIKFKGDALAIEDVQRALLLREGDIYSEQLFQESLKNINQLSLFQEIFWRVVEGAGTSSGVELLTNEKTSELTIIFNLERVDSELSDRHQ